MPSARKSALFLTPEAPFPMAGGGALRSASLLTYLAQTRDVDVLVFRQPGEPDPTPLFPRELARRVTVIQLPEHSRGAVARAWRNGVRLARRRPPLVDRFAGFERDVAGAVSGNRYEIGIVEHFWCAPYWPLISACCDQTVLDLHNLESALHARCAETEPGPAAFAHRVFRDASLELEREWLPRYSSVLAASENDAALVRGIAPSVSVAVYPNALRPTPMPARREEHSIVFSGNMEYHPNISAVRFFRAAIWPALRDRWPGLEWRLVGKNPAAVRKYVAGDERIKLIGPVDDPLDELARAKIAVVPLLAGSGTRFKILEAWAAGVPVVSTRVGAEGLPVRDQENILLADAPPDFVDAVSWLLACSENRKRLGVAGRCLFEQEFTWTSAWSRLRF